jgi:hypothetical protein
MTSPTATMQDTSLVPTYYVGTDMVLLLGESALVTSKSSPGQWREVDVVNHLCACPSFAHRRACRHVDAVKVAEEEDRQNARPIEKLQCRCGSPWTVHLFGENAGYYCGTCSPVAN